MIKLIGLLFIFVGVYAQETLYYLPDNHSRLQYELSHSFNSASQILIISPSLNHSKLSKSLIHAVKKGGAVKLIVNDPDGDPLSLIQYNNIELYLSSTKIHQTVILVDDSLVCTGNTALIEELYTTKRSMIRCSDNQHDIYLIRNDLHPLVRSAKRYLE